jgi:16S rRNA (guanine1516-N2)-methyltransferase
MANIRIAVSFSESSLRAKAQQLAQQLELPLIEHADESAANHEYLLMLTSDYLCLQRTSDKKRSPFYIDFLSGKMQYRQKHAGLRKELIARAIGASPRDNPAILDATAGLGRDSYILAALGFEVTLLERSPVLYAMLNDAIERAQAHPGTAAIASRLHLIHADALEWMRNKQFDIIYLDPMFPERQKSASIKKELALLQHLLGNDSDSEILLNLAITCATCRVVVKRPRLAPSIAKHEPNFSLTGRSSRFDIYLTTKR